MTNTPLTDAELDELEAKAKAATPGGWIVERTVVHGKDYGLYDVRLAENIEDILLIEGSGGAKSYTPTIAKFLGTTSDDANAGRFAANNEPQRCPNDCGPMWRETERDAGNRLVDRVTELQAALAEARERALEEAAKIFDERAALHARDATWMGPQRQKYDGARIAGVEMSPMNGPAISHDREVANAAAIRALKSPATQTESEVMPHGQTLRTSSRSEHNATPPASPLTQGASAPIPMGGQNNTPESETNDG